MMKRRQRSLRRNQSGFVLIALVALLVIGGLYFYLSNLSPEQLQARRQQLTAEALTQAQEAIIGYAVRYREEQLKTGTSGIVYGYLPLPDLGSTRNNNQLSDSSCYGKEGCEAYNFLGNGTNVTVIGRFPWRTLGTGPLRDAHGECLWYAVSGSHQRNQPDPTRAMNWDTLSQLDVVVAKSAAAMVSAVTSAHDRPIAVIFSSGPPLAGQDRSASATDNVAECGGNYVVSNYLDPVVAANLGGVTNYLAGANGASEDTSITNKALSANGIVNRRSDGKLWVGNCPPNDTSLCAIVANDTGVAVTSDLLFRTLRGSSYFRTDINTMLDRMVGCLRDQIAAGTGITPDAGFTAPADKSVGRIASSACYDDTQNPLGYFSHYQEQVLLAIPTSGSFNVKVDGTSQSCAGALLLGSQRGSGQSRSTTAEKNAAANYLEGINLAGFTTVTTAGNDAFDGDSVFALVSASQTAGEDIVRCVPSGGALTPVESPNLTAAQQLVAYDAASSTLTLGKQDVTNSTAAAADLFGCAWVADANSVGSGFRGYFQFTFATVGTNVGFTGFVYAMIDAESNVSLPCGSAGSHLGYSGDNGIIPKVAFPKIGIEFDQSRNSGFPGSSGESSTNVGRNDPCGTSGCGGTVGYNSHAAIVYWGHDAANATDAVTLPDGDDNVHGFPSAASLATTRRPPKNPDASPGIEFVNLRTGGQLFHVRVEVTPTRTVDPTAAENSKTSMQTKVWILADPGAETPQTIAMKDTTRPMSTLYPSFTETLSDTGVIFDVAEAACSSGTCPANQTCGTDNVCYRQALRTARLGFTGSQRTYDQEVTITDIFSTWLP